MQVVKLEITETFDSTVDSAISHRLEFNDDSIIERIESVTERFEASVVQNPLIYPLCQELVEIGVIHIRHAIMDGFRILYEVNEVGGETVILVLLFLSQRQSIQNQLVEHCLMHK